MPQPRLFYYLLKNDSSTPFRKFEDKMLRAFFPTQVFQAPSLTKVFEVTVRVVRFWFGCLGVGIKSREQWAKNPPYGLEIIRDCYNIVQ